MSYRHKTAIAIISDLGQVLPTKVILIAGTDDAVGAPEVSGSAWMAPAASG